MNDYSHGTASKSAEADFVSLLSATALAVGIYIGSELGMKKGVNEIGDFLLQVSEEVAYLLRDC